MSRKRAIVFLLISISVFCWLWSRRLVKETHAFLALGLTFSLSLAILLELANLGWDRGPIGLGFCLASVVIYRKVSKEALVWPDWGRGAWAGLGVLLLTLVGYTSASLNVLPDDDFWIHYPLQGILERNGLPILHPFFAEIKMNGHYGRDLLIVSIAKLSRVTLLDALFWQTLLSQVLSLIAVSGLVYKFTRSPLCTVLVTYLLFLGINVGGRGGLMDTYQNNNALAYFFVVSLFHLLFLVQERGDVWRVSTASFVLGAYALIYETHFGLIGLMLGIGFLLMRARSFLVVGLLALALASVQGGPITKVVREKISPSQRQWTPGEMNQHQIIKMTFPKRELFQIQLGAGSYQRRSFVFNYLPSLNGLFVPKKGSTYNGILSWEVLKIHWLSTWLAPLTLWALLRLKAAGARRLGLCFWTFGLLSYLVPGLVHFGPIYEFEYFRWQFAAGFGFAGALGVAAGSWLERRSWLTRSAVVMLLFASTALPTMMTFFPRTFAPVETPLDLFWPRSEKKWVLSLQKQLGGFTYEDYLAAHELKRISGAGDRLLVNSPDDRPADIMFSSTFSGLSGVRLVGHSMPWPQEPVGTPPFHRNAPSHAFWVRPNLHLLRQMKVTWVYLRPGREPQSSSRAWLEENGKKVWEHGEHAIFKVEHETLGFPEKVSSSTDPEKVKISELSREVLTYEGIDFEIEGEPERLYAWTFLEQGSDPAEYDKHEIVFGEQGLSRAVSPPVPGTYRLCLFVVEQEELVPLEQVETVIVLERKGPRLIPEGSESRAGLR